MRAKIVPSSTWNNTVSRLVLLAAGMVAALSTAAPVHAANLPGHAVGLGKVLTTKDGGQIFGFDINQNGDDGVLASAGYDSGGNFFVSMQTFDQNTGKITRKFATRNPSRNSYGVDGIFAGDVGLVTHYVQQSSGFAKREFELMKPVTGKTFTGTLTPPLKNIDIQMAAEDQSTATSLLYAIQLEEIAG